MGDLRRYAEANARVRGLRRSLLGAAQLEALSTYPSLETLRAALLPTVYGALLAGDVPPEQALAGRLRDIARPLLALLQDRERKFLRLYLSLHEVENLKLAIRAVHQRRGWEAIAAYVTPLPQATLDIRSLANEADLDQLAERLDVTSYGQAFRGALHRVAVAGPFAVEAAIEIDAHERLWAAAAELHSVDAEHARRLLGVLFDVLNLGWIARYRDALGMSPEEILNYTLRPGRWLNLELRRRLVEAPRGTWEVPLLGTPYAAPLAAAERDGFDAASAGLWAILAAEVRRAFAGDPFHIGVPLGLLLAQDIESRDLRTLLAAKRMQVPPAEIARHLALARR